MNEIKKRIIDLGKANWWIIIILILMWLTIIGFYYLKAEEITKDPCSICAERMGEKVICTISGHHPIVRTYHPNGSIDEGISIKYPDSLSEKINVGDLG